MQWEVEALRGSIRFLLFILIIGLLACSPVDNNENTKKEEDSSLINLENAKSSETTIHEAKATQLLEGSIEIPTYENEEYAFIPTVLTHNKIFGFLTKIESYNDVTIAYFDMNTNAYVPIKKAKGNQEFATMDVLATNDESILFFENNQTGNVGNVTIYMYTYENENLEIIHTIENYHPLFRLCAEIIGDDIYFNSLENSESEKIEDMSALYKYNIKSKEKEKIRKNTNNIQKLNNQLYFVAMDDKTTSLMRYDINEKTETIVYKGDKYKNEIFGYTLTDNEIIFLIYSPLGVDDFTLKSYRYYLDSKKLVKFIDGKFMEGMSTTDSNYISWMVLADQDPRGKMYIYDLDNNINYDYDQGVLLMSEDSILWTKYNTDSKDIPKGEVYAKGHTTLMYKRIDDK